MFQFGGDEKEHSLKLLEMLDVRRVETVLSLGCGIGGMEAYWKKEDPYLKFDLVNTSTAQLEMCLCEGKRICHDAETYQYRDGIYDLVVMAYVLGHVDAEKTLRNALRNTGFGGYLFIYDVFDGTKHFRETLYYNTPKLKEMERFGVENDLRFLRVIEGGIPLSRLMKSEVPWAEKECTPALFIFEV